MSQENKNIVEKINAAFSAGNTEGFLELCSEDVVWAMEGDTRVEGKTAIRDWMSQMEGSEPPKFTVDRMIADGDAVACYGTMSMESPAEAAGRYSYCDVYTFNNSKVVELRSFVVKHKEEGSRNKEASA